MRAFDLRSFCENLNHSTELKFVIRGQDWLFGDEKRALLPDAVDHSSGESGQRCHAIRIPVNNLITQKLHFFQPPWRHYQVSKIRLNHLLLSTVYAGIANILFFSFFLCQSLPASSGRCAVDELVDRLLDHVEPRMRDCFDRQSDKVGLFALSWSDTFFYNYFVEKHRQLGMHTHTHTHKKTLILSIQSVSKSVYFNDLYNLAFGSGYFIVCKLKSLRSLHANKCWFSRSLLVYTSCLSEAFGNEEI
ncbi:unnamed protein product [Protopolystoma xenopodis]|uniref:Uncharacterized protein n=1 Tax=Protopolystoma xenopodis TaxID=117903 RepID=A0A448WNV2_9PLAT|nr:unnamed protein product [Protopolystoma xenopodis]